MRLVATSAELLFVSALNPVVVRSTAAVQEGDIEQLESLLRNYPWLAVARFGDAECHRTLLHAATDWPGNFPNGRAVVERLVAAGADVNACSLFDGHTETALHWAASSDDVVMVDALLDAGADIEAPGALAGGGAPLADACGFGNWAVARRLVQRGARPRLLDAAALGLMDEVRERLAATPAPTSEEVTHALWSACAGGQSIAALLLVERGADVNWVGWDDLTPLDVAERERAADLVMRLIERGARHAADL